MASKRLSLESQTVSSLDIQEDEHSSVHSLPPNSYPCEENATSEYSSLSQESLFGSVQERKPRQCKVTSGEDIPPCLLDEVLTEADATEISNRIGGDWRILGRNLNFRERILESISEDLRYNRIEDKAHALLIKYIRQEGSDAKIGRLAEALLKIQRRDIVEVLIGTKHFASKTPDVKTFTLKEVGSFIVPDEDGQNYRFLTWRDTETGRLYLVRDLEGTGYEESCNALKKQDAIADFILKDHDVNSVQRAKIVVLEKYLQEINGCLEKQERNEDKIMAIASQQLTEDKELLWKTQFLVTSLTGIVSHLKDPCPLKMRIHSLSLGMSATLKDIGERIRMLKEVIPSDTEVSGQEPEKLLEWIRAMEETFKNLTLEDQQRPRIGQNCATSEPPPRTTRCPVDVPGIRRANTQPVSEEELRTLREQVAPAPDPNEEEDSVVKHHQELTKSKMAKIVKYIFRA